DDLPYPPEFQDSEALDGGVHMDVGRVHGEGVQHDGPGHDLRGDEPCVEGTRLLVARRRLPGHAIDVDTDHDIAADPGPVHRQRIGCAAIDVESVVEPYGPEQTGNREGGCDGRP